MTMPWPLTLATWTVPIVVVVLLIAAAWYGGVLLSVLPVPNLAWVIATSGGVGALVATAGDPPAGRLRCLAPKRRRQPMKAKAPSEPVAVYDRGLRARQAAAAGSA
jgi:hypothetical protein